MSKNVHFFKIHASKDLKQSLGRRGTFGARFNFLARGHDAGILDAGILDAGITAIL